MLNVIEFFVSITFFDIQDRKRGFYEFIRCKTYFEYFLV